MTKPIDTSRREFLRNASLLSVAGTIGAPFALNLFAMNVAAASTFTSDYKAIVCLYLAGGNDSANMVLATDTPSWAGYQAARGGSIALPQTNILPIVPTTPVVDAVGTRSFALHPGMAPLQALFTAGRAAVIANVGTLIQPIANITDYHNSSIKKPTILFSHSDQTTQWLSTDPLKPLYGWGGRMGDNLMSSNSKQNFTSISLSGNSVFLAGENINQYQVDSNGTAVPIGGLTNLFGISNSPLKNIITNTAASNIFEKDYAAVVVRAMAAQADLNTVMQATATTVPVPTQYMAYYNYLANNPVANQLRTVARIIAGQTTLGAHRQVFFVNVGGFDTHNGQLAGHGDLMAQLAHAMAYFDGVLAALPVGGVTTDMSSKVTLFTASDFGRTFASNGSGTDHGWGGHHFVVGGAVKGKEIYGEFPQTTVSTSNPRDVGSGTLIPNLSVDQYAATLAKWFGLDPTTEIPAVFPNLANFAVKDMGFMA